MKYLYNFGLDDSDIQEMTNIISDKTYSEMTLFENLIVKNIIFLKNFGVSNYPEIIKKYPEIFIRDEESFQNVLAKFDKEDLIKKIAKNPAVIKKMVDFVDNN